MPSMEQSPAEEVPQEQIPEPDTSEEPAQEQEDVEAVQEKTVGVPQFIREFSKEESAEERQRTAQTIRATRAEYFSKKVEREEKNQYLRKQRVSAKRL